MHSLGRKLFFEDGDTEYEADEGRAALDGPVHGDVHSVQRAQAERRVQREANRRGKEVTAVLQAERREAEHSEQPESVQKSHCKSHLEEENGENLRLFQER